MNHVVYCLEKMIHEKYKNNCRQWQSAISYCLKTVIPNAAR